MLLRVELRSPGCDVPEERLLVLRSGHPWSSDGVAAITFDREADSLISAIRSVLDARLRLHMRGELRRLDDGRTAVIIE